jgi:hypothetical protein
VISSDQIAAWAAAGESETLEFKRSTAQRREATRTLCAMLNHRGGRALCPDIAPDMPAAERPGAGEATLANGRPLD